MGIKINWNEVDTTKKEYKPLPDGDYICIVDNVEETETSVGEKAWSIKFKVAEGKYEGRYLFDKINVENPKKMQKLKALYTVVFGSKLPSEIMESDLIDEKILVTTTIETYNGKEKNTIGFDGYHEV